MAGYVTQQRKALQAFFARHPGRAMSVPQITDALRQDERVSPKPGQSTVYRLVQKMVEEGLITKHIPEGSRHFVYAMPPAACQNHLHLRCTVCDKLVHMDEQETDDVARAAHREGFALDRGQTVLFGRCAACGKEAGHET